MGSLPVCVCVCVCHPSLLDVERIAWEGIVPEVGGASSPYGPRGNPAVEHGERWRCSFWSTVLPENTAAREMALTTRDVPHRLVYLRPSLVRQQGPLFSGMTESGCIASFATVPPALISHIVDVSFYMGERRTAVVWDYRYVDLEVTSTTEWLGAIVPASPLRHRAYEPGMAMTCMICKADVPKGLMSCPRCKARFHYGFDGTREVVAQARMLFRIQDEAPTKVGKLAQSRAKQSGNQGRGVYSAMWRQCENAMRWTAQYELWSRENDHSGLARIRENYARGQTKWMASLRISPFLQNNNSEEPPLADVLAQAQSGHKEILEFRLWAEEQGLIYRVPNDPGKPDRGQRSLTGLAWVHAVGEYWVAGVLPPPSRGSAGRDPPWDDPDKQRYPRLFLGSHLRGL